MSPTRPPPDARSHRLPMIHHVHRSIEHHAHPRVPGPAPPAGTGDQRRALQPRTRRRPTSTSAFGVGRREAHDASSFYARFTPPRLSDDSHVAAPAARDAIWVGDARDMDRYGEVADNSVALVVTSPPYFAGKEYEAVLGVGHVPADYDAYLGHAPRRLRPVLRQARARRAHRGQRGQPRVASPTGPCPGTSSTCSSGSATCCGGRSSGRRATPPGDRAPGAPTSDRATRCCGTCPSGSSWPPRAASTGPVTPTSVRATGSPARGP